MVRAKRPSHGPDNSMRTQTELEFLPAALEVLETPPPAASRILGWTIVALFVATIIWLGLGRVDSVVSAEGELTPTGNTKTIQPPRGGTVTRLLVSEGQMVSAGDLLLELDTTDTDARLARSRRALTHSVLDFQRVSALLSNPHAGKRELQFDSSVPFDMANLARDRLRSVRSHMREERRVLRADLEHTRAEQRTAWARLAKSRALLPVGEEREAQLAALLKRGAVARPAWLSAHENLLALRHDIAIQNQQLAATAAARVAAEQALERYNSATRRNLLDELNALSERKASLTLEIEHLERERLKARVSAPVSGEIHELRVYHAGAVVGTGSPLMRIVPAGAQLTATAWLDNQDAGFVTTGHEAEVKLHGFPFTRYGALEARVTHVAAESASDGALQTRYRLKARIARQHIQVGAERVALTAGMRLSVEVKTGKRRILEYLLEPVLRAFGEALRER